jgi:hypothetical protein
MFFFLLVIAGNETTRNAVSGGMPALSEWPGEQARLAGALDSMLPSAVEEILRWVTPVMQFRRTALRDVELGGKQTHGGDKVVMYYSSAIGTNRSSGRARAPSTSGGRPTPIWPSGSGRTSAWARRWPGWRCGPCSRSFYGGCPTSTWPAGGAAPVELHQRIKHLPVEFTSA